MERSLVLSVSAGTGCYCHIRISENATLHELNSAILDSFDFFDDHMHAFFMSNRAWDEASEFICPSGDLDGACGFTDKVKLSMFYFNKYDKFLYIFDFGDDWRFQIKVLRIINELTKIPVVLKSVGQVNQYGDIEDDWDDD